MELATLVLKGWANCVDNKVTSHLTYRSSIMGQQTTAQALRQQLMAPRAIERVHALHALERELQARPDSAVARELSDFTARGVPYFAPEDSHYLAWVDKAVAFLDKLHDVRAPFKAAGTKPASSKSRAVAHHAA
jgi:hypothetical protein